MNPESGTGKYELLIERCGNLDPIPTAVAHPCEETALAGAVEAGAKKLIVPILVGPAAKIAEVAKRGLQRLEGKDYVVQEGDVLNIRFNV